eukprot:6929551-Alexandrium_andersonii.AAC.1
MFLIEGALPVRGQGSEVAAACRCEETGIVGAAVGAHGSEEATRVAASMLCEGGARANGAAAPWAAKGAPE